MAPTLAETHSPATSQPASNAAIAQFMLQEFEQQAVFTRKYLERVPEDKLTWKPHESCLTAGQLALHLATVPGGVIQAARQNPLPAPNITFPQPASRKEILDALDASIATVREVLPQLDDAAMFETWRLIAGDREVMAVPRVRFVRDIMLSHWYQHRGQLCVYLHMLDVPIPATWGPSADEPPPFMQSN